MIEFNLKKLGTFSIASGEVMVSDPGYEPGIWCQTAVQNVKNGEWEASVAVSISFDPIQDNRNMLLIVNHSDYVLTPSCIWEMVDAELGVDSGQLGIYDYPSYWKGDDLPATDDTWSHEEMGKSGAKFYDYNCHLTSHTEYSAGVLPHGVVSTSGYGDGGYDLFAIRDEEGMIVAMQVVFISPFEDEND